MLNLVKAYKSLEKEIISNLIFKLLYILVQFTTVVVVGHFFSPVMAGYYYVLNSYTALSVFFELGVSFVIMQNAAHESAQLNKTDFDRPSDKLNKLASLFSFTYKWFLTSSVLFVVLVLISSPLFFKNQAINEISWQGPLVVLAFAIGLNLLLNGVFAFFEGCRFMYEVSLIRIIQTGFFILIFLILVGLNFGLYAYGISLLASLIISFLAAIRLKIWRYYKSVIGSDKSVVNIRWAKELLPYQWRFAVSTISGFLVFQLINLLAFKFQGPILSGKLGLTISLINGIITISMVWFNTRAPTFATMVANREIARLNKLFKNTLVLCIATHLVVSACFIIFKLFFVDYLKLMFDGRLLDNFYIYILLLNSLTNIVIFGVASFCRAEKNEPFLLNSIVIGLINCVFSFFIMKHYSLNVFILFMFGCNVLVSLPWAYLIYKNSLEKYTNKLQKQ